MFLRRQMPAAERRRPGPRRRRRQHVPPRVLVERVGQRAAGVRGVHDVADVVVVIPGVGEAERPVPARPGHRPLTGNLGDRPTRERIVPHRPAVRQANFGSKLGDRHEWR